MKLLQIITASAIAAAVLASCKKNFLQEKVLTAESTKGTNKIGLQTPSTGDNNSGRGHNRGFVYTLSNQTSGNMVMAYERSANGILTYSASYFAGGNGTGAGLGNQGAVVIADNNNVLLAVNAGSNSISSLRITGGGLNLKSTEYSGGISPVSIAQYNGLVYVLNAGGTGNISGFRLDENDKLTPIPNSTRPLSSTSAGAAQISFARNGSVLVITEKATNKLITYTINQAGLPGAMHSINSASPTPFGFAAGRFGNIYVSEAAGAAANASNVSSYHINADGSISLTQGPAGTGQTAACWVVLTENGRYLYTTNAASNTISCFAVNSNSGNISLSQSIAATSSLTPIDAALADDSKLLYVLNGNSHSITAFAVASNGSLNSLPTTVTGLPAGSNGLAAY